MGIALGPFRNIEWTVDNDDKKKLQWMKSLTVFLVAFPIIIGMIDALVYGLITSWNSLTDHSSTLILAAMGIFLIPVGGFLATRSKVVSYMYWISNVVLLAIFAFVGVFTFILSIVNGSWGAWFVWSLIQSIYIVVVLVIIFIFCWLQYKRVVELYLKSDQVVVGDKEFKENFSENEMRVWWNDKIKSIVLFVVNIVQAGMAAIVIYYMAVLATTLVEPTEPIMWIVIMNFVICGFTQYFLEHQQYPGLQTYLAVFFILILILQIVLIVILIIIITVAEVATCGKWVCASPVGELFGYYSWGFAIASGVIDIGLILYIAIIAWFYGRNTEGGISLANEDSGAVDGFKNRFMTSKTGSKSGKEVKNRYRRVTSTIH